MVFGWFTERRRKEISEQPFPEAWRRILERDVPHGSWLNDEERERWEGAILVLLDEKHFEGCGGLELTHEIRVSIAGQAALLLIGLPDHDFYENVKEILVYPSAYRVPRSQAMGGVVSQAEVAVVGTAHHRGPLVLSWKSACDGGRNPRDGHNVVYHEFAHKLDMLSGSADGLPPLESRGQTQAWFQVMSQEYERLVTAAEAGRPTLLDDYGAESPAEFFAVAVETFFEKPDQLRSRHASLYDVLAGYFHQDPASRM